MNRHAFPFASISSFSASSFPAEKKNPQRLLNSNESGHDAEREEGIEAVRQSFPADGKAAEFFLKP